MRPDPPRSSRASARLPAIRMASSATPLERQPERLTTLLPLNLRIDLAAVGIAVGVIAVINKAKAVREPERVADHEQERSDEVRPDVDDVVVSKQHVVL